jgi:hypothetical protein
MPQAFNVVLIEPIGYQHSMALYEVGLLLQYSLQSLGYSCQYQKNNLEPDAINVLLAYHLLEDVTQIPDCEFIIYQLEQLSDQEGWFKPNALGIFAKAVAVWDYSLENIEFLSKQGVKNLKYLPLGFHEKLQSIVPVQPDIDFLFYGSDNHRRRRVMEQLRQFGSVHLAFQTYGAERDALIARSKIVLNIHFYEAQIMEQPRVSYLLNNRRFVLSEASPNNPYQAAICSVPYDQLIPAAAYWLQHDEARERATQFGYDTFRQQPMIENLRPLLSF